MPDMGRESRNKISMPHTLVASETTCAFSPKSTLTGSHKQHISFSILVTRIKKGGGIIWYYD